jgi:hypothetical protein
MGPMNQVGSIMAVLGVEGQRIQTRSQEAVMATSFVRV